MLYPYKTYYADLPGNCRIAYMDEGEGEQTLLFVHGLANYAPVWQKNIEHLKKYYRCIAIDLPGNGLSDKNDHPFGMRFFAESVYNFIKALALKKLTIVGHSMGGQVTMATALQYPGCADKIILCAPAGFEEFSAFERTLFYGALKMRDSFSNEESLLRQTIESSFYRHHKQGESVVSELIELMRTYKLDYYRDMIEGCIKGMLEEPVLPSLPKLSLPVLVIYGTHDALIPNKLLHHTTTEAVAKAGTAKIPAAKLVLLPDCGHFLQWEKADEVNRNIIMFMEGAGVA